MVWVPAYRREDPTQTRSGPCSVVPPTAPQPRPSVRSGPSSHHSRSSERRVVRECAEGVATMCQQYIPCVFARTGCSFCTHALSGYGSYLMAYFCGKRNCEATLDTGVAGYHTARERQMYGILVFTVVRDDGQRSGSLSAVGTPLPTPPYIAIRRAPFPTLPITLQASKSASADQALSHRPQRTRRQRPQPGQLEPAGGVARRPAPRRCPNHASSRWAPLGAIGGRLEYGLGLAGRAI